MESKSFETDKLPKEADFNGETAALICPVCGKVFMVSKEKDGGKRTCPVCHAATAYISSDGARLKVEWEG
ncbi:MAG: hypothetical protein WCT10_01165 [Patescibacteria group bacterium]|jgi:rubrerythrin